MEQNDPAFIAWATGATVQRGYVNISNPDLVERFEQHETLATWDPDTFYTPGAKGYTDYPKISE